MRKILLSLIFIFAFSSCSYGAVSEDMSVYLRKDVFDAKMEGLRTEIQLGNEKILNEIRVLNTKFETKIEELDKRITTVETHLSNRIDDLKTMVYWGFSIIGLLVAFAVFAPSLGEFLKTLRKPSFTLEDVKRLIEENNLRMNSRVQV